MAGKCADEPRREERWRRGGIVRRRSPGKDGVRRDNGDGTDAGGIKVTGLVSE